MNLSETTRVPTTSSVDKCLPAKIGIWAFRAVGCECEQYSVLRTTEYGGTTWKKTRVAMVFLFVRAHKQPMTRASRGREQYVFGVEGTVITIATIVTPASSHMVVTVLLARPLLISLRTPKVSVVYSIPNVLGAESPAGFGVAIQPLTRTATYFHLRSLERPEACLATYMHCICRCYFFPNISISYILRPTACNMAPEKSHQFENTQYDKIDSKGSFAVSQVSR